MATSTIKKDREGYPTEVGSSIWDPSDFNLYLTPGVYTFGNDTNVAASANKPCDSAGKLCVWTLNGLPITGGGYKYGVQDYMTLGGQTYRRAISTNNSDAISFTDWRKLYMQIPKSFSGYTIPGIYTNVWDKIVILPTLPFTNITITAARVIIDGSWVTCPVSGLTVNNDCYPFSYILLQKPTNSTLVNNGLYVCELTGSVI